MITARTHGTGVVSEAHLLQSNKQISLLANDCDNKKTTSELVVFSLVGAEMITARTHGTGVVSEAHLLQSNKQISLLANDCDNKKNNQ